MRKIKTKFEKVRKKGDKKEGEEDEGEDIGER
jgi:hypothetical protein